MTTEKLKIVFVLGTPRSGTHLLASTIKQNTNCQYFGELNSFWNKYIKGVSDYSSSNRLDRPTIEKIRRDFFHRYVKNTDHTFVLEKTPANSLRVDFLNEVFPEAKFIHIIRDGRDVAVSIQKKSFGDNRKITQHENRKESVGESISTIKNAARKIFKGGKAFQYLFRNFSKIVQQILVSFGLKKQFHWGLRYPGWKVYYKELNEIESAAMQWQVSVLNIKNNLTEIDPERRLEVYYEDIIQTPNEMLQKVFSFINYEEIRKHYNYDIKTTLNHPYAELSQNELQRLNTRIGYTLKCLGYID